jgi:hypothetical protein
VEKRLLWNSVTARSPQKLNLALGCLIYDALILAAALHARHGLNPMQRKTDDGAMLGAETIVLKGRCLVDFLAPKKADSRDIQIQDFGREPIVLPDYLEQFKGFASRRAAHLSWKRAIDPLPLWHEVSGKTLDECGLWILEATYAFINAELGADRAIISARHREHLEALNARCKTLLHAAKGRR